MGCYKTTSAINYINESDEGKRFLYITPYLSEVSRVIDSCKGKNFKQPPIFGNKLNGIAYLFKQGENIASTHQLFSLFTPKIVELIRKKNYVLIMDEVANVTNIFPISHSDLKIILNYSLAHVDKNGFLVWTDSTYKGILENIKNLCDQRTLAIGKGDTVIQFLPVDTFKCFKEVFILTYIFEAQYQRCYFDLYGIEYDYYYIKACKDGKYRFSTTPNKIKKQNYKNLINVLENEKMNRIGNAKYALSMRWYEKHTGTKEMEILKNNCYNFFRNYAKTKSSLNLWTCFKEYKQEVEGRGYVKSFVSCTQRATNDYCTRTSVAYLVNKYANPYIKNFFTSKGINVNEEQYALSEMLQFIWRSAIREGKEIQVYIPSKRMRTLFTNWLEEVS